MSAHCCLYYYYFFNGTNYCQLIGMENFSPKTFRNQMVRSDIRPKVIWTGFYHLFKVLISCLVFVKDAMRYLTSTKQAVLAYEPLD